MYVLDLRRVRAPPPLPEDAFEFDALDALVVFAVFAVFDALGALTVLGALGALGATALERLFLRLVLRW